MDVHDLLATRVGELLSSLTAYCSAAAAENSGKVPDASDPPEDPDFFRERQEEIASALRGIWRILAGGHTCASCRWWRKDEDCNVDGPGVNYPEYYRRCYCPGRDRNAGPAGMVAGSESDDSDWRRGGYDAASVFTGPAFSCPQHKQWGAEGE